MLNSRDYIREIQKFTTSQYWATGVRITAGVMLPTLVMAHFEWLSIGMPFLLGALFVSITDSPGPIHHRRNGLLTAVALNTFTVLVTTIIREHQILLLTTVVVFSFFYSLIGVFGNRAGAIGVLALVIMLLNLTPRHGETNLLRDSLLVFSGGMWYTGFSLLLYSIRPYRLAEQAVGENIIAVANYLRARASLYKEGTDIDSSFNKVMNEQSAVLKIQDQAREILFKTRQFIGDASPKSRSLMMIFIESIDLLEQTMAAYQDYELLHRSLKGTGLLNKFYGVILQMSAELEHIGLLVQSGEAIRKDMTFTSSLGELVDAIHAARANTSDEFIVDSITALEKGLHNLQRIAALMQRLVQYTRLEIEVKSYSSVVEVNTIAMTQPIRWQEIRENLTLKSNTFRHALRLTIAMLAGYTLSYYFNLSHAYWVLLTIVTILKPVYATSRKRNMQRVGGTLIGALLAIGIIYFITSTAALFVIMIFCMIMGYSLLRVNYFGFVLFLTLYIIITFHFLNPEEFRVLIKDRLVDTVTGSIIAFIAARFVLPVWGSEEIEGYMLKMLNTSEAYFNTSWKSLSNHNVDSKEYKLARKDAVVALTNLSENFQRILAEPKQAPQSVQLHQFVITSHLLMGHIAAFSNEHFQKEIFLHRDVEAILQAISTQFKRAENKLISHPDENIVGGENKSTSQQVPTQLITIYNLVHDINLIIGRMRVG
jgi:uncharacterized membrane protein YccC